MVGPVDIRNVKIGFIGFGSMAGAICDGLLLKKVVDPSAVFACARNMDRLRAKCAKRGINACAGAEEVAAASDIVVIAVLPQQVEGVVKAAAGALKGKPIVSIAAGIDHARYVSYLGEGFNHISTIPNTPVAIGEGIIVAEATHSLTSEQLELFEGVEEICEQITLINHSRVVLEGKVSDIKQQYKKNLFVVNVADGEKVQSQAGLFEVVPNEDVDGTLIKLASGATLHDAIAHLNEHHTLTGITEKLPSMNEIFIETVQNNA